MIYEICLFAIGYTCGAEEITLWFRLFSSVFIIDVFLFLMKIAENKFGLKKK
jgi:uncharacterized membrane protein YbhN (UPF0104 family)